MNAMNLSVGFSLLLLSCGCTAAAPAHQGVLQFHGSIVEPSCAPGIDPQSHIELIQCTRGALGSTIDLRRAQPQVSVRSATDSSAPARLLTDHQEGSETSQRYALIDKAGAPVISGMYVVTLSMP